jgi:hypothetical protein
MNDTRIITILPDTLDSYRNRLGWPSMPSEARSVVLITDAMPGQSGNIIHAVACDIDENEIVGVYAPHDILMDACVNATNRGGIPGTVLAENWAY